MTTTGVETGFANDFGLAMHTANRLAGRAGVRYRVRRVAGTWAARPTGSSRRHEGLHLRPHDRPPRVQLSGVLRGSRSARGPRIRDDQSRPHRRPREHCRSWLDFMRAALIDVAACDAVATLPGWTDSRGAAIEVKIADALGLPVWPLAHWLETEPAS